MRIERVLASIASILVASLAVGCVNRTASPEPSPVDWPNQPTRQQIDEAGKLIVRVYYLGTREGWDPEAEDYHITTSSGLVEVKKWIVEHAWPPTPRNFVGAVRPLGSISVFEEASDTTGETRFQILRFHSRSSLDSAQIDHEAWQEFLDLLARVGKTGSDPVGDIPG